MRYGASVVPSPEPADPYEREVRIAEAHGDPLAPLHRRLLEHCRLVEARGGISQDDIQRLCHEAVAGSQMQVARLVKLEMRRTWWRMPVVAAVALAVGLVLGSLAGCAPLPPEQQARLDHVVTVACLVDGVVQPISNPVVGSLGPAGATGAAVDQLLVHPAVLAACARLGGKPAAVPVVVAEP